MVYAIAALVALIVGFAIWMYSRGSKTATAKSEARQLEKGHEAREKQDASYLSARGRLRTRLRELQKRLGEGGS